MPASELLPRSHDFHRRLRQLAAAFIGLCGVYQTVVGLYFMALRPALLPEDVRFLAIGLASLKTGAPRLETWLHLVFVVLGGQMAAVGALVVGSALQIFHAQVRNRRELVWLGAAGLLSVGTMAGVNFALQSDFRWLLIAPGVAWSVGLALALASCLTAAAGKAGEPAWRGMT